MMDNNLADLFLNPEIKINSNTTDVFFKNSYTKQTYNLGYNRFIDNKFEIGVNLTYCKVQNLGYYINTSDSTSFILTEQLNAKYFGGELHLIKQKKETKKGLKSFHGFRVGLGYLNRKSNTVKGGTFVKDTLDYISGESRFIQEIKEVKNIYDQNLNAKVGLFNFNIKYTIMLEKKLTDRISIIGGIDIPLMRLFFFNGNIKSGIGLNTEDFFTGFQSYSLYTNNSKSFNKNFAYSLKKNQATCLKLGIKYLF